MLVMWGGPKSRDSRSRLLRCSPADFRTGSDRARRDGHGIASVFLLVNINPVVGGCAGGDVGEGAAGRRSRSSTYPPAFCFVGLARRAIAQALVLALLVIEAEPGADAGLGLGDAGIRVEVDLLIFEAAPQPLDEDVVHVAALAIHADRDRVVLQRAGEVVSGELAALVGIEDLGLAVPRQRFLEGLDTELRAERVRQPPRQHGTAHPVHDRHQAGEPHQTPDPFTVDDMTLARQPRRHPPRAVIRPRQVLPIDQCHDRAVFLADFGRPAVDRSARYRQQPALPRYRWRRSLALDQGAAFRPAHLPSFRDKKSFSTFSWPICRYRTSTCAALAVSSDAAPPVMTLRICARSSASITTPSPARSGATPDLLLSTW